MTEAAREAGRLRIEFLRYLADRSEKTGRFTDDMRWQERQQYADVPSYIRALRAEARELEVQLDCGCGTDEFGHPVRKFCSLHGEG